VKCSIAEKTEFVTIALSAEGLAPAICSHLALLQQPFPFVQRRLTLIGPRLASVSPMFSLIGAALPLVSAVVTAIGPTARGLRCPSCAAGQTGRPSRDPGRDLGSMVEVKFSPDPLQVALYGALGDVETGGNRTIGQAVSDHTSELPLSRGQPDDDLRSHARHRDQPTTRRGDQPVFAGSPVT
jgi:hypothetical protein